MFDLHVNDLEVTWILVCIAGTVFAITGLADAIADQRAVKALNGRAREIVSGGNVRREAVRLGLQVYMLILVIPGLFDDRPVTLSLAGIIFVLGIPVGLAVNSILDMRERRNLSRMTREALDAEREARKSRRRSDD